MTADCLPVAVRAWAVPDRPRRERRSRRRILVPRFVLVIDVETTIDAAQALTFGSFRRYRLIGAGRFVRLVLVEEGLFHADDLSRSDPAGFASLTDYATSRGLSLTDRASFIRDVLYRRCYRRDHLLAGFNLPFDLSRLAASCGEARRDFEGGFSLMLSTYDTPEGQRENRFVPRIGIKTIDSKRHLMGFTRPAGVDRKRLEGFRGHLLDVRTLAFAWTNESHSLASLCQALGVEHPKATTAEHGIITPEYIDYNRRDVQATAEGLEKLLAEHARHPIELQPTRAFSPASVGKGYLGAMGIKPILERQPDFPDEILGVAMVAYYGGRAEARIRDVDMPVVYLDFLSMYATVNSLMDLWRFVIAERIDVAEDTEAVRDLIGSVTLDDCFDRGTWTAFPVLVQIAPYGDVFPVRAQYEAGGSWTIGVNPLSSDEPLWYALPDVVASKLLSGRTPSILRAIRLVPVGVHDGLESVRLRGDVEIDPARTDFFRAVIEQRRALSSRLDLGPEERSRLDGFLKVLANAASYGIYAEIVRTELASTKTDRVTVHRIDGSSFEDFVGAVEEPGEYSFPPLAACITSAARLMLAMLERSVTDAGGAFVLCDTDSMAIVASRRGGLIVCDGGPERDWRGMAAVRALRWDEVEAIRQRFEAINPYDPTLVPGSVLELEDENLDQETGRRRQLWCRAISAKRYALFNRCRDGDVIIRKCSEHGLGHLLNPTDPEDEDRAWIRRVWESILTERLGDGDGPAWRGRPAVSRIAASTPRLLRPFASFNRDRPFADQIKPFSFLLSVQVTPFGHPEGIDPTRFHLMAPFESDPAAWASMAWTDIYSGHVYRITTRDASAAPDLVRVKSYRDVLSEHRRHPESKSLGPDGRPCRRSTRGLLARRPVRLADLHYVGKESNRMDDVEKGAVHRLDEVLTEYVDPDRDDLATYVQPILRQVPKDVLADEAGMHPRKVVAIRNGHARPRAKHRRALTEAAGRHARSELRSRGVRPPIDDVAACRAWLRFEKAEGAG